MPHMTYESRTAPDATPRPLRGWLEIAAIIVLIEVGGILGALTGFPPLSSIGAVALPLIAATWFLSREPTRWRDLALDRRLPLLQVIGIAAATVLAAIALTTLAQFMLHAIGLAPVDYSAFAQFLEGNLIMYLWMLIPVVWGSAAIGEELLVRGFLQHRLTGLTNRKVAVLLQALIFAVAHFYQGLAGVVLVFVVGLVFGEVYRRTRNLLPTILAHGVIDTVSMTLIYSGQIEWLSL